MSDDRPRADVEGVWEASWVHRILGILSTIALSYPLWPSVLILWGIACFVLRGLFIAGGRQTFPGASWAFSVFAWTFLIGIILFWGWVLARLTLFYLPRVEARRIAYGVLWGALVAAFGAGLVEVSDQRWRPEVPDVRPGWYWVVAPVLALLGGAAFNLKESHESS